MEKTAHTPTPWRWKRNDQKSNWYGYDGMILIGANKNEILSATEAAGPDSEGGGFEPSKIDADFILEACNNYEPLQSQLTSRDELLERIFAINNDGILNQFVDDYNKLRPQL